MADDWIKFRKGLRTCPQIVRISSALRADRLRVIGAVMCVWCLFDDHTEDGVMPGYTADVLDDLIGVPGLARAMELVGWLKITKEGIEAVRFTEHNGESAKKRAKDVVRKRSARETDKTRTERGQTTDISRTECGPEKEKDNIQNTLSRAGGAEGGAVDVSEPVDTSPPTSRPTIEQFTAECARYSVPAWFAGEAFATWEVKEWKTGKTPVSWRHVVAHYVTRDFSNAGRPAQPTSPRTTHHGHGKTTAAIDNRNAGTANAGRSDKYAGVGRTAPAPGGGAHVAGANGAAV